MLTWSNWKTEPRSNRYHYASRFARQLPVIFVQPDLKEAKAKFEKTEIEGVSILHVYSQYGDIQNKLINRAILEKGFIKPLLWAYNVFFSRFIAQRFSPLVVFHATEDYFSPYYKGTDELYKHLDITLKQSDLLVAVSEGVLHSYAEKGGFTGEKLLLPNGCDYKFWAPTEEEVEGIISQSDEKKIILYQGGLNWRLDWRLIDDIGISLPDWEIWLCGLPGSESTEDLKSFRSPNIKKLGYLDPERVRTISHQATVGIIPFKQSEIIQVSLPLKAFEYVACGLPVVSVPIWTLENYKGIFEFAQTADEFVKLILQIAPSRYHRAAIQTRLEVASEQDYDVRFYELQQRIDFLLKNKAPNLKPLKILMLYDANSIHINTIREHLQSFSAFSQSQVFYSHATHDVLCVIDLSSFDVIVIHYSVRLSLDWHLSQSFADALRGYGGYKILFIQDEYDTTETARKWIASLGIQVVFTCVPEQYVDLVYPASRFPYLERLQTLTGYVPFTLADHKPKAISERKNVIGYRGKPLPYYYGDLCREKETIAQRMKQICEERGVPMDIEYTYEKRIYGNQWYAFIEDCKATLGTESGSNVFDDFGRIKMNVELALSRNPSITYNEIHAKYIGAEEGKIKMNQISPRIFEAIIYRTALVLFEGTYSGVVEPEKHFIPLKKDYSNVDEVLAKLQDDQYLEALADRAYRDVVESGKYSYQKFISDFDKFLSTRLVSRSKVVLLTGLFGAYDLDLERFAFVDYKPNIVFGVVSLISMQPLAPDQTLIELAAKSMSVSRFRSIKRNISEKLQAIPFLYSVAYKIYRYLLVLYHRVH